MIYDTYTIDVYDKQCYYDKRFKMRASIMAHGLLCTYEKENAKGSKTKAHEKFRPHSCIHTGTWYYAD